MRDFTRSDGAEVGFLGPLGQHGSAVPGIGHDAPEPPAFLAELEVLRPLEDVVHVPTPDEEWKLLENVMPPELVARVRSES